MALSYIMVMGNPLIHVLMHTRKRVNGEPLKLKKNVRNVIITEEKKRPNWYHDREKGSEEKQLGF